MLAHLTCESEDAILFTGIANKTQSPTSRDSSNELQLTSIIFRFFVLQNACFILIPTIQGHIFESFFQR